MVSGHSLSVLLFYMLLKGECAGVKGGGGVFPEGGVGEAFIPQ